MPTMDFKWPGSSRSSWPWWLIMALPVLAYFVYVWRWAFGMPLMDDTTLIGTINQFAERGFSHPADLLLEQLNDHRVVFSRLAALLSYQLHGFLDVRWMALVGYANLLLLVGVLYQLFRTARLPLAYFAPVPFLLCNPHLYQINLWGLVAFQPPLATAFSLGSLSVLAKNRRWGWALPLAAMASFAGGNGLMAWVAGSLLLVVQGRFRVLVAWLLTAGGVLGLYFHEYHLSSATVRSPAPAVLLRNLVLNVVVFTGSYLRVLSDSKAVLLSGLLGAGVLVGYAVLLLRKGFSVVAPAKPWLRNGLPTPANWLLHAALVCMLGTAAMIGVARAGSGLEEMVSDRFHLYSTVLLALFYLVAIASLAPTYRRWALCAILPFSVLTNAYAYLQYRPVRDTMVQALNADAYNYPQHGVFLHQFPDFTDPKPAYFRYCRFPGPFSENSARAIGQAARRGENPDSGPVSVVGKRLPVPFQPGLFPNLNLAVGPLQAGGVPQAGVWLFLADVRASNRVFFIAPRREKATTAVFLSTGNFYADHFYATFPNKLPPGTYCLGLCWLRAGQPVVRCTRQVVKIK